MQDGVHLQFDPCQIATEGEFGKLCRHGEAKMFLLTKDQNFGILGELPQPRKLPGKDGPKEFSADEHESRTRSNT